MTVLEAALPLANYDDPECVAILVDCLEREGIVIRSGVNVIGIVTRRPVVVTATIEAAGAEQTITGSHLLNPLLGGRPTVDGLDLDAAGICDDRSGIAVVPEAQNHAASVYAIGDCPAGRSRSVYARGQLSCRLVIRNALFRLPVRVNNPCRSPR